VTKKTKKKSAAARSMRDQIKRAETVSGLTSKTVKRLGSIKPGDHKRARTSANTKLDFSQF